MQEQKKAFSGSLPSDAIYHYRQYQGNFPYYSEFPKLKFIKKDDWRFSSDIYHRYCNLNSPLNKCYITSTPNAQFLEKSLYPRDEKLDYLYLRGYKKILNQELDRNYERYGYDTGRQRVEDPQPFPREQRESEFASERAKAERERRFLVKSMVKSNKAERTLRIDTDRDYVKDFNDMKSSARSGSNMTLSTQAEGYRDLLSTRTMQSSRGDSNKFMWDDGNRFLTSRSQFY